MGKNKCYRMTGTVDINEQFITDRKIDKRKLQNAIDKALEVAFDDTMFKFGLEGEEVHGILLDDFNIEVDED